MFVLMGTVDNGEVYSEVSLTFCMLGRNSISLLTIIIFKEVLIVMKNKCIINVQRFVCL